MASAVDDKENTMKFALLIYENEDQWAQREDPDRQEAYWGPWMAFSGAVADVNTGGAALIAPETATTVRVREGQRQVQDGPFPDAKEQLGGFFLIDVEDLDAALAWAERCPNAAGCAVEVRPLLEMG